MSWCTDEAVDEAALIKVRLVHAFSLAFWYCSHWDFRSLQCVIRDVYVSSC